MNFYAFHIGDYVSATAHLSWDEDMAYRRLLDAYYSREEPIPLDLKQACRLARAVTPVQVDGVQIVLIEFFEKTPDGWVHARCDEEIVKCSDKRQKAQAAALASVQAREKRAAEHAALRLQNESSTDVQRPLNGRSAPNPNPNPNPSKEQDQERESAQETAVAVATPPAKKKRASQLNGNFSITQDMADWASEKHPGIDFVPETNKFYDFYVSKGEARADWVATWRNWIRKADEFRKKDLARYGATDPNDTSWINKDRGIFG